MQHLHNPVFHWARSVKYGESCTIQCFTQIRQFNMERAAYAACQLSAESAQLAQFCVYQTKISWVWRAPHLHNSVFHRAKSVEYGKCPTCTIHNSVSLVYEVCFPCTMFHSARSIENEEVYICSILCFTELGQLSMEGTFTIQCFTELG